MRHLLITGILLFSLCLSSCRQAASRITWPTLEDAALAAWTFEDEPTPYEKPWPAPTHYDHNRTLKLLAEKGRATFVDLNGDGVDEALFENGIYVDKAGRETSCDGMQNRSWAVMRNRSGAWEVVGSGWGSLCPPLVLKGTTHGWRDLESGYHLSVAEGAVHLYQFDGERYRLTKVTERPAPPLFRWVGTFEDLLADQCGSSWKTFEGFLASTREQPEVRRALADSLVKQALDGPTVGMQSAPRHYLHDTYFINMLKAMGAREHLKELLGPNRRYASAFELGCCVGPELVNALAVQGHIEDAWLLVEHIPGGHIDGQAEAVHEALRKLTGADFQMPLPGVPATTEKLEAADLALAAMWSEYLTERRYRRMKRAMPEIAGRVKELERRFPVLAGVSTAPSRSWRNSTAGAAVIVRTALEFSRNAQFPPKAPSPMPTDHSKPYCALKAEFWETVADDRSNTRHEEGSFGQSNAIFTDDPELKAAFDEIVAEETTRADKWAARFLNAEAALASPWSEEVNGLRARLVPAYGRRLFIAGEPMPVRLDIECVGTEEGHDGAQLFPHVCFWLDGRPERIPLPVENRVKILKGKIYSRHFDLKEIFAEIEKPGKYALAGGHSNDLVTDIGDWTGDLRSWRIMIEVLPDTKANRRRVECSWYDSAGGLSQAIPAGKRTLMTDAEVRAELNGLDVDTGWTKDGAPDGLKLERFEKVGLEGQPASVLIAGYSNRQAPGEQSTAEAVRLFRIVGERFLPVDELGVSSISVKPEFFEHAGQQFMTIYLGYKGGGPTYIWWLDGTSAVRLKSEDPEDVIAGLLKNDDAFLREEAVGNLTAHFSVGDEDRGFWSEHRIWQKNARGQFRHVGDVEVAYRLEKNKAGRPLRFIVSQAERRERLATELAPEEVEKLCAEIRRSGASSQSYRLLHVDWRRISAEVKTRIAQAIAVEQNQRDKDMDVALARAAHWFDDEFAFDLLSGLAASPSARARCLVCSNIPYRGAFAARALELLERLLREPETSQPDSVARAAFASLARMDDPHARQLTIRHFLAQIEPYQDYRKAVYAETRGWRAFLQAHHAAVAVPWLVRLATLEDDNAARSARSDLWWFAACHPEMQGAWCDAVDDPVGWFKANEELLDAWIEDARQLAGQPVPPQ